MQDLEECAVLLKRKRHGVWWQGLRSELSQLLEHRAESPQHESLLRLKA